MSESEFEYEEKTLIKDFIKKISKECLIKHISFNYDLYEKRYVGNKYDIPRGNASADKWSDRVFSDDFFIEDMISYEIIKKKKKLGNVHFIRYVCSKFLGEDIVTINIKHTMNDDYYHIYEFYPGIGIRILKYMPSSKHIDYSGFKTKYKIKEIIRNEYNEYKSKIGRSRKDIVEFFNDKRKNLVKLLIK